MSKHIESGTSGCAVVDQRGDLLGVISTASVPPAFPTAVMALARSLPWWVWRALVKVDGLVSEPADVVPSGPAR